MEASNRSSYRVTETAERARQNGDLSAVTVTAGDLCWETLHKRVILSGAKNLVSPDAAFQTGDMPTSIQILR